MDVFIGHWTAVDAALGAQGLLLPGGITLTAFQANKTLLTEWLLVQLPSVSR
jgi:hypothetical protein